MIDPKLHNPLLDSDTCSWVALAPWTPPTDSSSASTTSTTPQSTGPSQALYLTEPGDTTAISVTDLNQGSLGDCFLISSIGELAMEDPAAIQAMIKTTSSASTQTVTLYESPNGSAPTPGETSFKAVSETVTDTFPAACVNQGATQEVVKGVKEIWPQVLEKAVAELGGGYQSIANGGNPTIAMEELTGHAAQYYGAGAVTASMLQSWSAAKDLICLDAGSGSTQYNVVGDHAYMFDGMTTVNGQAAVKLLNPWGFDEPNAIPVSQLTKAGIVEVDVGHA